MTTDVSNELSSQMGRRIQPTFGYYRKSDGWISVSPITRLERLKYIEEGWTCLDKYGAFDMTPYIASHPFEGLFMFGGAGEMPAEQVIQTGLYFDPPLVPRCRQHLTQFHRSHTEDCWRGATRVEFPQLTDVPKGSLGPFPCDFCERKLPTRKARDQHQSVAHSKELGNIQQGRSLGESLATVMSGVKPVAQATEPSRDDLVARIAELEKRIVARRGRKPKRAVAPKETVPA